MSWTVSVGQITGSVRYRGSYELPMGQSYDDDDIGTGLMLDFVDSAYREAYDMMATADVDRFVTSSLLQTTGGVDVYSLPTDFYRLRGVDAMQGPAGATLLGNDWFRLEPYGFAERDRYRSVRYQAAIPKYHLEGQSIRLAPAPQGLVSINLWYVPVPPRLVSADQTVDMVNGWEETIVQMVLCRCMERQRQDCSDFKVELTRQVTRLMDNSRDRDRGSPKRAIDPRAAGGGILRRRRSTWSW